MPTNEQIASAYAIAKILGSELSVQEFQEEYSQYHDEVLKELNSKPAEYAKCEAFERPF